MSNTLFARGATTSRSAPRSQEPARRWLKERVERAALNGKFAEFGVLTPDLASILLDRNEDNRPLSPTNLAKWISALQAGDWQDNGESIKVATTGELNDGQHRCRAVIDAGVSMPALFVFGVTRASRKTVDVGTKRTAANMLAMSGVANTTVVASSVKSMLNIEAGVHILTHRSVQEIERALGEHPGILNNAWPAQKAAKQFHQSQGLFVAVFYLLSKRHAAKAAEFFTMLADGTAPTVRHPVALLRNRLIANLSSKAKLPITEVAAVLIKATQAFVAGRALTALRWRNDGAKPEAFPKVP